MAVLQQQIIACAPIKQQDEIIFLLNKDFNLIYEKIIRLINHKEKERFIFETTTYRFECDKDMADKLINETSNYLNSFKKDNIKEVVYSIKDREFKVKVKNGFFKRIFSYLRKINGR